MVLKADRFYFKYMLPTGGTRVSKNFPSVVSALSDAKKRWNTGKIIQARVFDTIKPFGHKEVAGINTKGFKSYEGGSDRVKFNIWERLDGFLVSVRDLLENKEMVKTVRTKSEADALVKGIMDGKFKIVEDRFGKHMVPRRPSIRRRRMG